MAVTLVENQSASVFLRPLMELHLDSSYSLSSSLSNFSISFQRSGETDVVARYMIAPINFVRSVTRVRETIQTADLVLVVDSSGKKWGQGYEIVHLYRSESFICTWRMGECWNRGQ